jgi:DNA-binding sugar fermentation-stimulating protein
MKVAPVKPAAQRCGTSKATVVSDAVKQRKRRKALYDVAYSRRNRAHLSELQRLRREGKRALRIAAAVWFAR